VDLEVALRESAARARRWAAKHGRTFPWRTGTDYEVAVAEVLLQKTRGEAVAAIWSEVLRRYPSPDRLGRARVDSLRRVVAPLGLGEQRSRRLIAMARSWGDSSPDALGPYGTAVLALSRGERPATVPVDGNVARVIQRHEGWAWERGEPRKKPELRIAVSDWLSGSPAVALRTLYALVDLGALVCTPRNPKCPSCPLRGTCASATVFLPS